MLIINSIQHYRKKVKRSGGGTLYFAHYVQKRHFELVQIEYVKNKKCRN